MKIDKSVQITLIITIGIFIFGIIALSLLNKEVSTDNTIQVYGTATLKVIPDLVTVYFNVQTEGKTSKEAGDSNSEITDSLTNSLIALGFSKEEIQTQGYSIYPRYDYENNKQEIIGYTASHSIRLEMPADESDKIGNSVEAGINSGAGISYINFELSQENQNIYKAEAMKLAAQDATIKAESVAEGFNKKLGNLVSTSINDFGYYPWPVAEFAEGTSSSEVRKATTNIQPSEQEISASVVAVFKLR